MINLIVGLIAFGIFLFVMYWIGRLYYHIILLHVESFWSNMWAGLMCTMLFGICLMAGVFAGLVLHTLGAYIITLL